MSDFRPIVETGDMAFGWEDGQPSLRKGGVVTSIADLIAPDLVDLLDVPWEKASALDVEFERYIVPLDKSESSKTVSVVDATIWAGLQSGFPSRQDLAVQWIQLRTKSLSYEAARALRDFVEAPAEGKDPITLEKAKPLLDQWREKALRIPSYQQKDLKEFVRGVLDNLIFLSTYIKSNESIGMVFMPLALGALCIPDACLNWLPELPPEPVEPREPIFPPSPREDPCVLPEEPEYNAPDPKVLAELEFRIRWNHETEKALADYRESIERGNAERKAAWEAEVQKAKDEYANRMEAWDVECEKIRKEYDKSMQGHRKALRTWKSDNKDLIAQHRRRNALDKRLFMKYSKQIGVIWEFYREALPRSCNGYPMFMSCRLMNIKDWKRCVKVINKELERREKLTV